MTGLIIKTEKDLDLWVAEFIQNSKGFLNTVDTKVAKIIKDVRNRGDKAIIELSRKFDFLLCTNGTLLRPSDIEVKLCHHNVRCAS